MLVLGNAVVLGILGVLIYARVSVGPMMGRGISASEFSRPYISLITTSGIVGLLALAATTLFWMAGLLWIPDLKHYGRKDRAVRLTLIVIPLWFALIYLLGRILLEK